MAAALLEKETIDGAEVGRLVDEAFGRPVHGHRDGGVPRFGATGATDSGPLDEDETVELDRTRMDDTTRWRRT